MAKSSAAPSSTTPGALSAHIVVREGARAIGFYCRVFGAREGFRLTEPGGRLGHAELLFGDGTRLSLSDEYPDFGALSPASVGGTPVSLHLVVADVDATLRLAEEAGATILREAKDEFYGDRAGQLLDPFGHRWMVATRRETVSPEEMQRRWTAMLSG